MIGLFLPVLLLAAVPTEDRHARAVTAFRVAAWARDRHDAQAMLAAARMLADAGVRTGDSRSAALDLADEAVEMAPDDAVVSAAAAAVRDAAPRGIIRGPLGEGPIAMRHMLIAGATAAWPMAAQGGATAIVSAVGDGDVDIDLTVTQGRRTVCADVSEDPNPMCRWRVPREATYKVAITNKGRLATRVVVLSN